MSSNGVQGFENKPQRCGRVPSRLAAVRSGPVESECGADRYLTRRLSGETQRLVSPAAAFFWRLLAMGTTPGHPHGVLFVWPRWERFALRRWPTTEIPGAPYGLLAMRIAPYQGKAVELADGTIVEPKTFVGELHCNNPKILTLVTQGRGNPFRACREDLRSLAAWTANSLEGSRVRAFYGVTLLSRGAARLGFEVRRCQPTLRTRLDRMFMIGLLLLYNREGLSRLSHGSNTLHSYPQEAWMSRGRLMRLYGACRNGLRDEHSVFAI